MSQKRSHLALARKAQGYTQEGLAEALHIDRTTVIRWETTNTLPQPYLWPKLARCLNVSPAELQVLLAEPLPADHPHQDRLNELGIRQQQMPTPDAAVLASQGRWRSVRNHLDGRGTSLARKAAALYDPTWRMPDAPTVIAPPAWQPPGLLPLADVASLWEENVPYPRLRGDEAETRSLLPLRAPGRAFTRYTTAIRYLNQPRLFENRPSYRLLGISADVPVTLRFGTGTYFDKLDVSEALTHEFAAAAMEGEPTWSTMPFRALFADPLDLSSRTACPGIGTLTIRRDTTSGSATFFLLERNRSNVAVGGGEYGVLPAGEFQPSSIAPESMRADLDLWRNIVREYSEELLGEPEHDGSSGQALDYDCWPFYRRLQRAREAGQVRPYLLGIVLHALSLNIEILTAVVFDDVAFDELFRDLSRTNAEGALSAAPGDDPVRGMPFDTETVTGLLESAKLGGTSAACLAQAWRHREGLLAAQPLC